MCTTESPKWQKEQHLVNHHQHLFDIAPVPERAQRCCGLEACGDHTCHRWSRTGWDECRTGPTSSAAPAQSWRHVLSPCWKTWHWIVFVSPCNCISLHFPLRFVNFLFIYFSSEVPQPSWEELTFMSVGEPDLYFSCHILCLLIVIIINKQWQRQPGLLERRSSSGANLRSGKAPSGQEGTGLDDRS